MESREMESEDLAAESSNAGDIKLHATMTDATLVTGLTLNGLSLAVEKPGSFIVEYNVHKKPIFGYGVSRVIESGQPIFGSRVPLHGTGVLSNQSSISRSKRKQSDVPASTGSRISSVASLFERSTHRNEISYVKFFTSI